MNAIAVPQKFSLDRKNLALARRIGVRFDGMDCGSSVLSYDAPRGVITMLRGKDKVTLTGLVEPYWRAA